MNYYSHNIGDYAQATMHLTLVEDAIYSRLLRRYYAEEAPIVDDIQQVCRWVGARTEEERAAVSTILAEFFILKEGHWHNKRADEEIAAYRVKAETAKANGRRGGRPKRSDENPEKPSRLSVGSEDEPSPNPAETESKANQEPRTNNQEPEEKNTPPTPRKRGAVKPLAHTVSVGDLESKGVPADVATEFIALRNRRRAALTEIALAGIQREADSVGWTLQQALRKCIERGWQGFDASWVQNQQRKSAPGQPGMNRQEALEASNREIALRWAERNAG